MGASVARVGLRVNNVGESVGMGISHVSDTCEFVWITSTLPDAQLVQCDTVALLQERYPVRQSAIGVQLKQAEPVLYVPCAQGWHN